MIHAKRLRQMAEEARKVKAKQDLPVIGDLVLLAAQDGRSQIQITENSHPDIRLTQELLSLLKENLVGCGVILPENFKVLTIRW